MIDIQIYYLYMCINIYIYIYIYIICVIWTICVLQWFVSQVVTSYILKIIFSFSSSRFPTLPNGQDKNVNTLW